jgi:hypothetical protein
MSYASQFTGQTPEQRREEASRLLRILEDIGVPERDDLTGSEDSFLRKMYQDPTQPVSGKEVLYLRDIKDKYL